MSLIGEADRSDLARLRRKLPTASLVVIDFAAGSWDAVAPADGRLERFVVPPPMPNG